MSQALQFRLLECALMEPGDAYEQWMTLLEDGDVEALGRRKRRLLPAIQRNLEAHCPDFPGSSLCQAEYDRARQRNVSLRRGCIESVRLLQNHNIESIVLKGVYLSDVVYNDLGLRFSSDIDLLIEYEKAYDAIDILEGAGWEKTLSFEPSSRLENEIEFTKGPWKLDLHWFLLREARNPGQDSPFWAERGSFVLDQLVCSVLSPTHQFFHLIVAAAREPHNLCRYLLDIHAVWGHWKEEIDLGQIEQLLIERHLLSRLTSLPLAVIGCEEIKPVSRPTPFDWIWSNSSGTRHDWLGECLYSVFPFLDYWLHFRNVEPLGSYLKRRLEVRSAGDAIYKSLKKVARLVRATSP